ncbi:MAG: stage V sporulation protein AA [Eubacteriales bacterium]|nr:stage V sporulation protein AA [Eubacteriales bacterium]
MSESLYMQFDKNVEVDHPKVQLQDVAKLACRDEKILNRCRVMPVMSLDAKKPGRYVVNVMDIVDKLGKAEAGLDLVTSGEPAFIVTFVTDTRKHPVKEWLKAIGVCIITFFGMSFSIMTFNNDVDLGKLFSQIYQQVMGVPSNGFTVLEISYSVGLGLGVLFFFNHFGKWKLTQDPTPMQVQMRLYEEDVNTTILEDRQREQAQSGQKG